MSDLDLYTGLPREVLPEMRQSLAVWADEARQAATVARSLAPTPFVPQSLRAVRADKDESTEQLNARTAANITAAILTGAEVGLTPMAALRSIVVIQGTPAMTAIALRGLVQSAGHQLWIESSSDTRVIACGRRRGSEQIERSVWTIERAAKLGLTGKQNWKQQPESMLVARATSEVARRVAADVLLGLPYSVEELADTVETEPQRTARRRAAREPAPMPEPALEDATPPPAPVQEVQDELPAPEPEDSPEPVEDGITDAQSKKLHAALRENGLSDREAGLAYISQEIGRDITTTKELTKREASAVIDGLGAQPTDVPEPTLDGM